MAEPFARLYDEPNCKLVVAMSGTFFTNDRSARIANMPYRQEGDRYYLNREAFEQDPYGRYVEYTRANALAERAIARLNFEFWDLSDASYEVDGIARNYTSFADAERDEQGRLLATAISTEYATELLDSTVKEYLAFKETHPWAKLLVVAGSIPSAQSLVRDLKRHWQIESDIATSDDSVKARTALDRFRGVQRPALDALVTVQMAYEGLDAPAISHIACLTRIRSRQWLEQCFSRANRLIHDKQYGYIWLPYDRAAQDIVERIQAEQDEWAEDSEEGPGGVIASPISCRWSPLLGGM